MNLLTHTSNVIRFSNMLISTICKLGITFFNYNNYCSSVLMKKYSQISLLIIKFIIIIQGPTIKWIFYLWIGLNQNIVWYTMVWSHGTPYQMYERSARHYLCSRTMFRIFICWNISCSCRPLWSQFFLNASTVPQV